MRRLFGVVAPRYDFITRVFSYGMDGSWKKRAVTMASLPEGAMVLDLACGTGDFSKLVRAQRPRAVTIACDLTESMLRLARNTGVPNAVCGDAAHLPFEDNSFDAVFAGYGVRNFPDLAASIREIHRVLGPGGVLVTLDFVLPQNAVLRQIFLGYLYAQGAFWGALLHREPRIYTYIPDSLRSFVTAQEFSGALSGSGFRNVTERAFLLGGIALHRATK